MNNTNGKLIVIDGTDGSGKATQVKLLADRLEKAGFQVEVADFPQYGKKSAGMVEEYLSGRYGDAESVSPYVASILYSVDRYDASFQIKKWLSEGKVVVSNRYTSSNMAHQGGKIKNPLERKAFFDWIKNLEEQIFRIPKPDLTFFLHVEAHLAQDLTKQRAKVDWAGKIKDIHEESLKHLKEAEKTYIEISQSFENITLISCMDNGRLASKDEISNVLWELIRPVLKPTHNKQDLESIFMQVETKEKPKDITIPIDNTEIVIKKLSNDTNLPKWSENNMSIDIYSHDYHSLMPGETNEFRIGASIELPKGYMGLILNYSESGMPELSVLPSLVPPNFNKEIVVKVLNASEDIVNISPGRIIAKMIIQKTENPLSIKYIQ